MYSLYSYTMFFMAVPEHWGAPTVHGLPFETSLDRDSLFPSTVSCTVSKTRFQKNTYIAYDFFVLYNYNLHISTHMLHGAGIFTNICPKKHPVL